MSEEGVLTADEFLGAVTPHLALPTAPPRTAERVVQRAAGVDGWVGKRLLDVTLSVTLLLLTLPVFLTLAVLIRLTSRGPVLFRQRRVGRGGQEFRMLKFRTMHLDSEERLRSDPALHDLFVRCSHKIPSHLDPRVTAIGRVLRRFSLDELPQLLNVLLGQMSIVGPRPVEHSQLVRDYRGYESAYTALRPGLTGLWQVSGRSTVQFPARAQLDSDYVRKCSPWVDAKIILRTPIVVFIGLGAD